MTSEIRAAFCPRAVPEVGASALLSFKQVLGQLCQDEFHLAQPDPTPDRAETVPATSLETVPARCLKQFLQHVRLDPAGPAIAMASPGTGVAPAGESACG